MSYKLKMFVMYPHYPNRYIVYSFMCNFRITVFDLLLKVVYSCNFLILKQKPLLDTTIYIWMLYLFVTPSIQVFRILLFIVLQVSVTTLQHSKKASLKKLIALTHYCLVLVNIMKLSRQNDNYNLKRPQVFDKLVIINVITNPT